MPYPIDDKLVIAVSSSALFDMQASDAVFRQEGEDAYRKYQQKNIDAPLEPGVAFTFVKRLLDLNTSFPKEQPIEVILFLPKQSRNRSKSIPFDSASQTEHISCMFLVWHP